MTTNTHTGPTVHKIAVYDVKLVKARKPLTLREESAPDSSHAARVLHDLIGMADREQFAVLFLGPHHEIQGVQVAAIGGQSTCNVDVRTVLRGAILASASAVILAHNHPSGDPTPSQQDCDTTVALANACRVVGVPLLDHIIVTRDPDKYRAGWGAVS